MFFDRRIINQLYSWHQHATKPDVITALTISNDHFVTGSDTGKIKIWNFDGKCIKTLADNQGKILTLANTKDRIIVGAENGPITIWDSQTEKCINTLKSFVPSELRSPLRSIAMFNDKICAIYSNGIIEIWDLIGNWITKTKTADKDINVEACTSNENKIILSFRTIHRLPDRIAMSLYTSVKVIDSEDLLKPVFPCQNFDLNKSVSSLAIKDDKLILGLSDTIEIWHLMGEKLQFLHSIKEANVSHLAILGDKLCSTSKVKYMAIWNLETGKPEDRFLYHSNMITSLACKDGKIISGSLDKTIIVWDFLAREEKILREIAKRLKTKSLKEYALSYFEKIHETTKNKIFVCLYEILKGTTYANDHLELFKPDADASEVGALAFKDKAVSLKLKSQAIQKYLESQTSNKPTTGKRKHSELKTEEKKQ